MNVSMLLCYKRMQKEIFLTLFPHKSLLVEEKELICVFLFFLTVLHTPVTALNQASLNIFFTIPFLHGCRSQSLIFLTFVQFPWPVFPPWYLEVAENLHSWRSMHYLCTICIALNINIGFFSRRIQFKKTPNTSVARNRNCCVSDWPRTISFLSSPVLQMTAEDFSRQEKEK